MLTDIEDDPINPKTEALDQRSCYLRDPMSQGLQDYLIPMGFVLKYCCSATICVTKLNKYSERKRN